MQNGGSPVRTRVKICGITRPDDGLEAARLGADAIGLVFYAKSPRAVTLEQARAIVAVLPPFVTTVGLFVDAQPAAIHEVLDAVPLDLLQFHGNESVAHCEGFARPYIKALVMGPDRDVAADAATYAGAAGILLDAYHPALPGGSGEVFDWNRIPANLSQPVILAGGLHGDNIGDAVRTVRPYGVDVSSGVESAKGIKDAARMAAFIRGVQRVDSSR